MLHFLDQNLSCFVFSSYFLSFSLFLLPSGDSLDFINQTFNSLLILAVSLLLFKNLLSLQQLLLFLVATSSQTFQQKFWKLLSITCTSSISFRFNFTIYLSYAFSMAVSITDATSGPYSFSWPFTDSTHHFSVIKSFG